VVRPARRHRLYRVADIMSAVTDDVAEPALLQVRSLTVALPPGAERRYAVDDISFDLAAGGFLAVVGRSGSGKSMLARTIAGFCHLDPRFAVTGEIAVAGTRILECGDRALQAVRGSTVGFVFQNPFSSLNPLRRLDSQLVEALHRTNLTAAERRDAVRAALAEVELPTDESFLARRPHEVSGGQCQRVAIAIMLLLRPALLILDEPTTALDSITSFRFLDMLRTLRARTAMTVLYISHDLRLVAENADDVLVLDDGRIADRGSTSHVFRHSTEAITRKFRDERASSLSAEAGGKGPTTGAGAGGAPSRVLKVRALWKSYEVPRPFGLTRARVTVLRDVAFDVDRGERIALVGRSGSGKSTLARCLAGLEAPDSGGVERLGDAAIAPGPGISPVQVIFQDPAATLHPKRTLFAIFWESLRRMGVSRQSARARAAEALARTGLPENALDRHAGSFSGGQCQRLTIARALLVRPRVIVADEPTASLDVVTRNEILDLFRILSEEEGIAVLLISHDLRAVQRICSRVLVLDDGSIVDDVAADRLADKARGNLSPALAALATAAGLTAAPAGTGAPR